MKTREREKARQTERAKAGIEKYILED